MTRACLALLFVSAAASAEPPGETPLIAPVAPGDPLDQPGLVPVAEHGMALDSALVVPADHVEVSARYLSGLGAVAEVAAGLGGGLELWAEAGSDQIGTYGLGLKWTIARAPRWRFAIEGTAREMTPQGSMETSATRPNFDPLIAGDMLGAGAIGTGCFDLACHVIATAAVYGMYDYHASGTTRPYGVIGLDAGGARLRAALDVFATPDPDGTIGSMLLLAGRVRLGAIGLELGAAFGTDDQDRGITPIVGVDGRL